MHTKKWAIGSPQVSEFEEKAEAIAFPLYNEVSCLMPSYKAQSIYVSTSPVANTQSAVAGNF